MADRLDHYDLYMSDRLGRLVAPLIERLRNRTLTRRGYERLRAIIVENAFEEGQPDATAAALEVLAEHWTYCPMRYLPTIRVRSWRRTP